MIVLSVGLSGCLFSKSSIGVVDREKAFKQSTAYSKITSLGEEIKKLESGLRAKRDGMKEELIAKEKAVNEEIESTWRDRVGKKQEELNRQLQEDNKGFIADKERQLQEYLTGLEAEFDKQAMPLDTEANLVSTSSERRAQIEGLLRELQRDGQAKAQAKHLEIQKEIEGKIGAERQQLAQELDEYSLTVREALVKEQQKKGQLYLEEKFGPDQKRLNELKAEQDVLLKSSEEKLKASIELVAKNKKLTTVLVDYVANVKAVDITDDVLKELNAGK